MLHNESRDRKEENQESREIAERERERERGHKGEIKGQGRRE
jgi:hypothetical protein